MAGYGGVTSAVPPTAITPPECIVTAPIGMEDWEVLRLFCIVTK